ncbi:N-acetylglucosamine kinase of eukaryotic type [Rubellimicrobium mesophilum DSM 19309]|uniref:N-acetylglucosamine kinase of eukaryotic type n=1 Tax=Rubellimicrobium mesophilum DSM 19309 TaxID=442562 RepID=A0A017HSC5_9RHOB|nr:ROK family protein [Rubellimicrobium mesophilum]EYD77402.1 N-acetylglucosamine kinase of eukaryotic type [Rubellimicrobium mesophilum DSM 19309]
MTAVPGADPEALIVGIDIGGTKTHLRAELADGGGTRDLIRPSAEWRRRDWDSDAQALLGMVAELTRGHPVVALGIGAHGCDDADECDAFQAAFSKRTLVPLAVVNDAELMPLALGLHGQIGVVAGTGAIAVCRPASGEMLVSGAGAGSSAMRAARQAWYAKPSAPWLIISTPGWLRETPSRGDDRDAGGSGGPAAGQHAWATRFGHGCRPPCYCGVRCRRPRIGPRQAGCP